MPRANPLVTRRSARIREQQNLRSDQLVEFYDSLTPELKRYVDALTLQLSTMLDVDQDPTGPNPHIARFGRMAALELLVQTYRFTEKRQIRS